MTRTIGLDVDGEAVRIEIDVRTTLLDALRERLGHTAPKKGCDHGQCGSCTVILDGRRHLTCLSLAVAHDGATVTTSRGLAALDEAPDAGPPADTAEPSSPSLPGADPADLPLHRVQQAFLDHDGLQCGYCTPGQVCSAVGALAELAAGQPSHVTDDLSGRPELSDAEIRERMSGNLCRCGAYAGIVAAVRQAAGS
ncbi:2Fe-2S iron-sulfur cluster-binding protein [Agilicoccus flavus]|uniref:2Fe-2S iron-sulfur cluster-binding protein n=1 Tax=Agilicoccus flavus TaxID=2775968 RepID=UPI001CF6EA0D|nr:2Fe-2S iron-sulfur cluster-binding protein [Agilicoccus flavus]